MMAKALTALLMIVTLMFGSVGVPAFADAGTGGHAIEMVDLDCHAEVKSDGDQEQGSPKAPPGHLDHHHCSTAIPQSGAGIVTKAKFASDVFMRLDVRGLNSHQTAPPTQPPSA